MLHVLFAILLYVLCIVCNFLTRWFFSFSVIFMLLVFVFCQFSVCVVIQEKEHFKKKVWMQKEKYLKKLAICVHDCVHCTFYNHNVFSSLVFVMFFNISYLFSFLMTANEPNSQFTMPFMIRFGRPEHNIKVFSIKIDNDLKIQKI